MTKLFGVDIAKELNKGMGPGLLPCKLTKVTPGARDASDPTAGTHPKSTTYPCRGFVDDFRNGTFKGTAVEKGDRRVLILGGSLPAGIEPRPADTVTVEGRTYRIEDTEADPARAAWVIQARGQ